MKIKKIKYFIAGLIIVIYVLSYGLILTAFEHVGLGKLGYLLYEPIEFARVTNIHIWTFYENCYRLFGGSSKPQERTFFSFERKGFDYYDNGVKKYEATFHNKNLDGYFEFHLYNGRIIFKGTYKSGKPYDGILPINFFDMHDEVGEFKGGIIIKQYPFERLISEKPIFHISDKVKYNKQEHHVLNGETIDSIAELYGIDVNDLIKFNNNIKQVKNDDIILIPYEDKGTAGVDVQRIQGENDGLGKDEAPVGEGVQGLQQPQSSTADKSAKPTDKPEKKK